MPHSDFVQRGAALLDQGRYPEAIKTCRLGLMSRPTEIDGRIVLGRALLALGRYDEALHEMKAAIEQAPSAAAAYVVRGEALLRKGEVAAARAAVRLALGLSPDDENAHALLDEIESTTAQTAVSDPTNLYSAGGTGEETETKHYAKAAPAVRLGAGTPAVEPATGAFEGETARAGPQEDTLLVPLPSAAPTPATPSRVPPSAVAKKHNTEPLSDDALVEVPAMSPRPTMEGRPSKQSSAVPPPRPSAMRPAAQPPPIPSSFPPPPPSWAEPPPVAYQPPPPPAYPPPSAPPPPLPPQRAGAFQAYQTHLAAPPPSIEGPSSTFPGAPVAKAPPSPARPRDAQRSAAPKRKARTGWMTAVWILVGAAVIGGGVLAGFQIRDLRLRRQIAAAERRGEESSAGDAWLGWRVARDGLASISAARKTAASRATYARAQAVLAYELGDGVGEAGALVRGLDRDPPSAAARAYMALLVGDAAAAAREADRASELGEAAASYLKGRAALLAGDAKAAVAALEKSYRVEPRPFTAVALAQARVGLGQWEAGDKVLGDALAKAAGHPALTLARVQLALSAGKLDAQAAASALSGLGALIAEADKPLTSQSRGVSPWQKAMALLTKSAVHVSRGERQAALGAIAAALDLAIDEQRVAEATINALVFAESYDVALSAGKRALAAWPQSVQLRIAVARAHFGTGHITEAIEALPDALVLGDPAAIALRVRARLLDDDLEGARRDLQGVAKATSPELAVARALVALAGGEEVEPLAKSQRLDAILVEAQLARARGAADKALALLGPRERLLGGDRYAVLLELGRAYREVADYASARSTYNELMASANPHLRLETAQLLLEDRDPKGASVHIEALLRDRGDKATGAMYVEAMRIRTLTGATTSAEELSAKAAAAGAAPWMLQRETARIARRRDDLATAAVALGKALDGSKADLDTILMACDVVDAAPETMVSKLAKIVEERLTGMPDQLVAQGKLALSRGDVAKATELFDKAAQRFKERPAAPRRLAQVSFGAGALAVGRGEWLMARRKLEAAIELDPSLIDAYTYLAVSLARNNEVARAVTLLKSATALAPESALVWETLADYARVARDAKTAAEASSRAASLRKKK